MSDSGSDGFYIEGYVSPEEIEEMEAEARAEEIFSSGKPFPVVSLPPELLDEIFAPDKLSPSELATCCRLSQSLLPHARKALYSTLAFTFLHAESDESSHFLEQRSCDMADVVGYDEELAVLVKSVVVDFQSRTDDEIAWAYGVDWIEPEEDADYELPMEWAEENSVHVCSVVQELLLTLPYLNELDFSPPPDVYVGFIAYTVLFRLTSLKIPSITIALVHCLPNLTSLDCTLYDEDADFEPGRAHPPQLQQVNLQLELATSGPNEIVPFFDWLTRNSHDSLTRLALPYHPLFQPTLAPFSNLSHFKLIISADLDSSPPFGLIAFASLLQSITSSLESLCIISRLSTLPPSTSIPHTYLTRLPPSLVVLTLHSSIFSSVLVIELVEDANKALPRLKRVVLSRCRLAYDNSGARRNQLWEAEDFELFKGLGVLKGLDCVVETEDSM